MNGSTGSWYIVEFWFIFKSLVLKWKVFLTLSEGAEVPPTFYVLFPAGLQWTECFWSYVWWHINPPWAGAVGSGAGGNAGPSGGGGLISRCEDLCRPRDWALHKQQQVKWHSNLPGFMVEVRPSPERCILCRSVKCLLERCGYLPSEH